MTTEKGADPLYNLLNSIDNSQLFESDCATRPLIDKMVAQLRNAVEILQQCLTHVHRIRNDEYNLGETNSATRKWYIQTLSEEIWTEFTKWLSNQIALYLMKVVYNYF